MQSPLSFSSSHSNPTLSPLNILTDFTPPLPLPELERATDEDPRQMNRAHQKQLRAWWSYAFAAECFAAVAMSVFIPVTLEQSAREVGFLDNAQSIPCMDLSDSKETCKAAFFGLWKVDSGSFSLYTFSLAAILQTVSVISMGSIANHPSRRKLLLLSFASLGSLSAMLFPLVSSPSILSILAIIGIASFSCSFVCSNSFLPDLGRGGEEVRKAKAFWESERERVKEEEVDGPDLQPGLMMPGLEFSRPADQLSFIEDETSDDTLPSAPLLPDRTLTGAMDAHHLSTAYSHYILSLSTYTSRISLVAIAIGYIGGVLVLIPAFVLVTMLKGSTVSLKLAVAMSGALWFLASGPAAVWLGSMRSWREGGRGKGWAEEIRAGWTGLGKMIRWRETKRLKNTFLFLLAWMFLSDAASTFSSTAIIFAKVSLKMSASAVTVVAFLALATGIVGGFSAPIIQSRMGWSNKKCLVVLVVCLMLLPAYGCLGLLGEEHAVGGIRTPAELYVVATLFGLVFGPFQSFSRTVFSELIPPGEEARWFGLYSITDKSSAFLGPFVVGLLADLTGEIRYGFIFLFVMLAVPLPLLIWWVDVAKGREDAKAYSPGMSGIDDE